MLAEYLDLSPATVSFVLNNAPGRSIPPSTRERVKAAAKKFGFSVAFIPRPLELGPHGKVDVTLEDYFDLTAPSIVGLAEALGA